MYSEIIFFSKMVAHADILLSKCAQFRNESQFIDVQLKVGEDIFPAHRIVLAASSDYFYAMFTDGMKESNQEVIELRDESISPDVFKIILDSIYTGDLLVDEESVSKVLAAADHLQVASAVHQCCNFLLTKFVKICFDFETYCRIWEIALSYGLKDLQDAAECAVAKMYTDVCESKEFLTHISGNQLVSLLGRDDLNVPSETFVFISVMQWINHKKEERMAVAAKVIGAVRLGLADIGVVIDDLDTKEMKQLPEIYTQVYEAAIYKHRPTHKPQTATQQTKQRSKNPVLVAVSPRAQIKYFDVEAKAWKLLPIGSPSIEATHCYCALSAGSNLFVAAKDSIGYCLYRYDPEANVWERLPNPCGETKNLCLLEEYLYAIPADCSLPTYRYNVAKRNWHISEQPTGCNRFLSSAAVLHSKVFIVYGCFNSSDYGCLPWPAVLLCFDSQTNVWETEKATTNRCHFRSSLIVVNGKLYAAGGKDSFDRRNFLPSGNPAPVEMYNEDTDTWSVVEQKRIPANNLNAVEIEGRIYFIINNFPVDSGIRIAHGSLDSALLNEWDNLAKIDQNAALGFLVVNRKDEV